MITATPDTVKTANDYRIEEIGALKLAWLQDDKTLLMVSMLRPDLHFIISGGKVKSVIWATTSEELWADTRETIAKGEIERMASMSLVNQERLDWLSAAARQTGIGLERLDRMTRPIFSEAANTPLQSFESPKCAMG